MALAPGTQLGPYSVIAPLGAGGMGEVYRARDSRLEREVAIKLLPASLSADPEALRRIQQEARTLAALNHPSLLTIFDFGATPEGAPYLVCELLQGETLRERSRTGALPVREAIAAGSAVARGLAAAHGSGIVHRDLKPENIFCTTDGRVKILDFGLAKLTAASGADAQTLAGAGTQAGVVLGTLGYMAPEQARGQAADARADIFSLGAVLYEMFSGQPAFRGATPADTLSAILREEPPELTLASGNAGLAAPLDRIVRHCLEKNPARRFQSADDLGFALESVGSAHSTTSLQMAAVVAAPSGSRRRLLFAGVGTLGLILAAWGGWWSQARLHSASAPSFERLTYSQGQISRALFLPDGHTVVATGILGGQAGWQPFTARLDSPGMQSVSGAFDTVLAVAGGTAAVLQHLTTMYGFERYGTLALTPVSGGAPRPLLDNIEDAAFAPGAAASGAGLNTLLIVRYHPDTQVRSLEFPPGHVLVQNNGWYSQPRFSPDGQRIAVLEHPEPGDDNGNVLVLDTEGHVVLRGPHFSAAQGLAWSPRGGEIWYSAALLGEGRTVYALSLSGRNRSLLAGPEQYFVEDTLPNGDLLVRADAMRISSFAVTPSHPEPRDITVLDWANTGNISPDGKYFLVGDETAGPDYAAFLETADGAPPVRLGPGDALDISGDDQWALSRDTRDQLWLLPLGAGSPRQLTQGTVIWSAARFVPGKQAIVADGNEPGHDLRDYLVSWNGDATPLTPEGVYGTRPAPDGKSVLVTNPTGTWERFPFQGGPPQPLHESIAQNGIPIRFGPDANSVYVQHHSGLTTRVDRLDLASGTEQPLFTLSAAGQPGVANLAVMGMSADGRSYMYLINTVLSTLYVVHGVR